MTFDRKGAMLGRTHNSGMFLLGIASMTGRLTLGLLVIFGRKARTEGGPLAVQVGQLVKGQTPIFFKRSISLINPHVKGAGAILRILVAVAIRNLQIKARPRIIETSRLLSRQSTILLVKSRKQIGKIESVKRNKEISHEERDDENINLQTG